MTRNRLNAIPAMLLAGMFQTSLVFASCEEPKVPDVPDGATASKKELLQSYREIQAYKSAAQEYLDCLDLLKLTDPDADVEIQLKRLQSYNRTVDRVDHIADEIHAEMEKSNAQ